MNQPISMIIQFSRPICFIFFALFSIFVSFSCLSGEQNASEDSPQNSNVAEEITPEFNVELEELIQVTRANESFWLDIGTQKTLVLKYWARGRVTRGNLILLHAQGEHADHPRVVHPLARQLSEQGWHVYIPNLAIEDYPRMMKVESEQLDIANSENDINQVQASNEPTNNPNDSNKDDPDKENIETEPTNLHFFGNEFEYQNFVNQTMSQLITNIQPKFSNLMVVANQNSGYWVLDSLKTNSEITQIVLIEPQIPLNITNDLENAFSDQNLPVFTFIENEPENSSFIRAFDRQLWRSSSQRINRGHFSNQGIPLENTQISKLITGWVMSLQKKK